MRSARLLTCVDVARPRLVVRNCAHLDLGDFGELDALADGDWAMRTPEVARVLGVSRQTVVNMVERDWLRATYTEGGHRRVERDSVEELKPILKLRGAERVAAVAAQVERNRHLRGAVEEPNS